MMTHSPKPVAAWLAVITLMVALITVFGGLVRLTGSGLSMVDWNVIMGVVPPMNEAEWQDAFEAYKAFPEYQKLNADMQLSRFKFIYFMEYAHRVIARSIGLAVLIPFVVFVFQRRLSRRMMINITGLFCLGGLQGLAGWYMVKSGLSHDPYVCHYRLTMHLSLALLIMAWSWWLALRHAFAARVDAPTVKALPRLNSVMTFLTLFTFLQLCLGGMVAGSKAGHLANHFPTMIDGQWFPPHLWGNVPWYTNFTDNLFLLNFMHRWLGVFLAISLIAFACAAWRKAPAPYIRLGLLGVSIIVVLQVLLGISTLVLHVPLVLGSLHQAIGVILWCSVIYLKFCVSGAACQSL
jgi:cytochrome c oxidase assembly protein subunit 15